MRPSTFKHGLEGGFGRLAILWAVLRKQEHGRDQIPCLQSFIRVFFMNTSAAVALERPRAHICVHAFLAMRFKKESVLGRLFDDPITLLARK